MKAYTFAVDTWPLVADDITVTAPSEKAAHRLAWETLTEAQKNHVQALELVDEHEAAA